MQKPMRELRASCPPETREGQDVQDRDGVKAGVAAQSSLGNEVTTDLSQGKIQEKPTI